MDEGQGFREPKTRKKFISFVEEITLWNGHREEVGKLAEGMVPPKVQFPFLFPFSSTLLLYCPIHCCPATRAIDTDIIASVRN
jgi:hypothetical protein